MTYQLDPYVQRRLRRYRIVVGIDLSEYSEMVLEHALDQAARHDAPELHLLTVRERRRPSAEDVKQELWERVYPALEAFNRHGTEWRARLHVRRGRPDEHITMLAAETRADLIVIGQFGLHHRKPSTKDVPALVLRAAVCPTLVIGLPESIDSTQCPMCSAVREDTEGEFWFCEDHGGSRNAQVAVTPMTSWTHGEYSICSSGRQRERAA